MQFHLYSFDWKAFTMLHLKMRHKEKFQSKWLQASNQHVCHEEMGLCLKKIFGCEYLDPYQTTANIYFK